MLLPLKSMLFLLSQLPGKLGDLASVGLDKLNEMEANFNLTERETKAASYQTADKQQVNKLQKQ